MINKIWCQPSRQSIYLTFTLLIIFLPWIIFNRHLGRPDRKIYTITINNKKVMTEVAETDRQRQQGLSGRPKLPKDAGLAFEFPTQGYYPFWNNKMRFPIDVLWIDWGETATIVDWTTLPIDTGLPVTYQPRAQANLVLEVNAGLAKQSGWEIGQPVSIKIGRYP